MFIDNGRVNDPASLSEFPAEKIFQDQKKLVIQFSRPEAYRPDILKNLDDLCDRFGERLQVRFYGHTFSTFDAAVLRYLPNVANLSLNCLTSIVNEAEITALPRLTHFGFGVFEFDRPQFLRELNLRQLNGLILIENRKRNFDLSPLSACNELKTLFINGHWKNIEAISHLPSLSRISLSGFPKARKLDFLNPLLKLTELTLLLGGREDIGELANANIEKLEILRMRGLQTVGRLGRFPELKELRVEDQLQIQSIDLAGVSLTRLELHNCKNLKELLRLADQSELREFGATRVALDMDGLRDFDWPSSTKLVRLYSGRETWNKQTKKALEKRGIGTFGTSWD